MDQQPKEGQSSLNKIDRGFVFMMDPEDRKQEDQKTNFNYKLAKVVSFFNQEISFRLELIIKPKEK